MANYTMIVMIPMRNVPTNISIQEAKITGKIWLKIVIPDAQLIEFKEEKDGS